MELRDLRPRPRLGQPSKSPTHSRCPTSTKVLEVISSFQKNTRISDDDFVVLFHLVVAAGNLASENEGQPDGDRLWTSLILDGRLERAIVETFADKGREPVEDNVKMEIDKMGTILRMKCEVWRGSCGR